MSSRGLRTCTDREIGEILSGRGLTLVLVIARWDGNGAIMQAVIKQLVNQFGKVTFYVTDNDENPKLGKLFNVSQLPTILYLKDGELVHRIAGPTSRSEIERLINKYN